MTTVIWRRALAAGLRVALIDARCLRQNRASLAALEVGKGKPRGRDQSGSVGQCRRSNRRSEQASRAKRQPGQTDVRLSANGEPPVARSSR